MNLKCLICSDLFTPSTDLYSTTCGHLFHYHCLIQWINRSKTCPQCRANVTVKTIHRIFLSIEENAEVTDLTFYHNKLDNLEVTLKMKEMEIKKSEEKYVVAAKQNTGLREEVKTLETKIKSLECGLHNTKEQILYFKTRLNRTIQVEEELENIRNQMKNYKQMKSVLDGNQEELSDMIRNNHDVHSLSILVIALKKQLMDTEKSKVQLQTTTNNLHAENHSYRKKIKSLLEKQGKVLKDGEEHVNCIKEREFLKKTIMELQDQKKPSISNSINRLVTESPIPVSKLLEVNRNSPSVSDVISSIKDSDSPYLKVQSSSVGLSLLVNYNRGSKGSNVNKESIFTKPSLRVETLKRPLSTICYDGLGGHSKEEHHHHTSSKHEVAAKRLKPSASLKFKKLSGSQQKLNFSKANVI